MPDTLLIVLALALLVLVWGVALTILSYVRRTQAASTWKPVDVSHLELAPPLATQPIVTALAGLGFRRLGEAGRPELAERVGPAQVWYFTDRDATTCAGVFAVGAREGSAVIYSWFGEQAVIVTGYPSGEQISRPNFRFNTISTSVEDAYRHHLEQLPDFTMRYGSPRGLDNMEEILRLDAIYNAHFAGHRLRPAMLRALGTPLLQFYLIVVLVGAVAGIRLLDLPPGSVLVGMALLALPAIAIFVWERRMRRSR